MRDVYHNLCAIYQQKLQRLTMRQRNKKIVLVEQSLPYPTLTHNFVQHPQDAIQMKIYSEEKNQFGQLAEIFYEAIVSQPIINKSTNSVKSQNASLLVLKDRSTKRSSDFSSTLQQKGIQDSKFVKKTNKTQKNPILMHRKSQSSKIERNEQSFFSYRSVSYSSEKKQRNYKHFSAQSRCQSARKYSSNDKENNVSDFTSCFSNKKAVKTIKYSILPARKMI